MCEAKELLTCHTSPFPSLHTRNSILKHQALCPLHPLLLCTVSAFTYLPVEKISRSHQENIRLRLAFHLLRIVITTNDFSLEASKDFLKMPGLQFELCSPGSGGYSNLYIVLSEVEDESLHAWVKLYMRPSKILRDVPLGEVGFYCQINVWEIRQQMLRCFYFGWIGL